MAKLHGPFDFNGTLKGLSAYTMQGCEGIILRTPYGPSKEDIKTKPSYDITRRNNREFGGRSTAVKWIRNVLHPLKPLFDHNISAPLNTLLKPIQEMDQQSEFGERHVLLSLAPGCWRALISTAGTLLIQWCATLLAAGFYGNR